MNIIKAVFTRNEATIRTLPVYQYNRGMILNISGLDDLPSTFRADFSNTETGQSKTVIGTDGEVHIPYEYFVPGATIHCWLVWTGADYVVTRKHILIPVARRATPTDEEPTPEEQGVIDQAIAALNDAVAQTGADVETAGTYAEQAEQSAQAAATSKDAAAAAKDQAVQSATNAAELAQSAFQSMANAQVARDQASQFSISASESAQSASQSKADAQAAAASVAGAMDTLEATIQADLQAAKESGEFDGPQGPQGVPGEPGADGATFTPAVSSEGVISWTNDGGKTNPQPVNIKGPAGATGPQGERGLTGETGPAGPAGPAGATGPAGADGISPTIAVTDITGGHRVTITDATSPHSFDVLDGDAADVPVQDVQVDGTSILDAQGVANVPIANDSELGVVKTVGWAGVKLESGGLLNIRPAGQAVIKAGTNSSYPLASNNLNAASFYGLAKAAGANMASSSNPVGTYTDEAKVAIQKMLGVYEAPWELIADDTLNENRTDFVIETDSNGLPFQLVDVFAWVEFGIATTEGNNYVSCQGRVRDKNGSYYTADFPTQRSILPSKSVGYYRMNRMGDMFITVTQGSRPAGGTFGSAEFGFAVLYENFDYLDKFVLKQYNSTTSLIPSGTRIRLYGRRKWQ